MARRLTTFKAWGGFVDGKLDSDWPSPPEYDAPRYAIFTTRKSAKAAYQDVRRIEVMIKEKP